MGSFNPERELIARISDDETKLHKTQEELLDTLVPQLETDAVNMDHFVKDYGQHEVNSDKKTVAAIEKRFAEKGAPRNERSAGKFFEAIMHRGIQENDFLGPAATPIVASRYDDYVNGIDSIIEFEREGEARAHMALAIDVTRNEKDVSEKFENIARSIKSGKLSEVKYFESEKEHTRLAQVVRVIVGADTASIGSISDLMIRADRMKAAIGENARSQNDSEAAKNLRREFAENRKRLAQHPLQWIVLTEMEGQLIAFQKLAARAGKMAIVEEYGKILEIVREIINEKKAAGYELHGDIVGNDKVLNLITKESARVASHGL